MRSPADLIRFASTAAVTLSVTFAGLVVGSVAVWPPASSHTLLAIGATAVYLPIHLHHLRHGLRGERAPWGRATLAVMAVVTVAVAPTIGPTWLFALFAPAASALLVLGPVRGFAVFSAAVVAAAALAADVGSPAGVIAWVSVGVVFRAVTPFVLVWLACALRDLDAAREALAREAVLAERARLEGELGHAIGGRIEAIAEQGRRITALETADATTVDEALRDLVAGARDALAQARRVISSYRRLPARTELESAADLLRAVGMDVRVTVPDRTSNEPLSEELRRSVRDAVADLLLAQPAVGVTLALTASGEVRMERREERAT